MTNNENIYIEHVGVKGMHWGVRKEETDESYSKQLEAKYGKDSMKEDVEAVPVQKQSGFASLSSKQKKIAIAVGSVALIGVGVYLEKKYTTSVNLKADAASQFKIKALMQVSDTDMKFYNTGLVAHWEDGVNLPAGSIVKRLSTVKETEVMKKGFYCAFDPEDIRRYEAELPKWWKRWGYSETEGFLTNIKANKGVKAPTGKETYEMFKEMLRNENALEKHGILTSKELAKLSVAQREKLLDGFAKQSFSDFTVGWIRQHAEFDPWVINFFGIVKSKGYNALIDFNDSGHLSKTPLRILNGDEFSVTAHEFVSADTIKQMQETIKELVMAAINYVGVFLEHRGLKVDHEIKGLVFINEVIDKQKHILV